MNKEKINKSFLALIFTTITIGALTLLTYKTNYGIFLIASFGSSMVLLYGYPESPFAKPKNILFGHLITSLIGILFYKYIPLPIYILIPIAVGFGVGLMILLDVTHPPAGGNPIIVILGSVSFEYLFSPVLTGSLIIIVFGILLNRFVAQKKYPWSLTIHLLDVPILCYTLLRNIYREI